MSERPQIGDPSSNITKVIIGASLIFWAWTGFNWEPRPLPPGALDGFQTGEGAELLPGPLQIRYVVQPGDTLSKLAARFGSSVEEIVDWNGLTDADFIKVGWSLRVK